MVFMLWTLVGLLRNLHRLRMMGVDRPLRRPCRLFRLRLLLIPVLRLRVSRCPLRSCCNNVCLSTLMKCLMVSLMHSTESGIIVFNVKSGRLHKKGRIEVLMDDGYWPCFSTPKARSTNAQWDYVGEGFLKEIDFGQVWLRLDQAEGEDKDDIAAEWMGDAKAFLSSTLVGF